MSMCHIFIRIIFVSLSSRNFHTANEKMATSKSHIIATDKLKSTFSHSNILSISFNFIFAVEEKSHDDFSATQDAILPNQKH